MKKVKLLFGTGNTHKVQEFKNKMPDFIELLGMRNAGIEAELRETRDTIKGNALQKVEQLSSLYEGNCFSEDTGLCVPSLGGAPGVHSARYAGPDKVDSDNIDKLLSNLAQKDRSAYFLTVIALWWDGEMYTFEGKCSGRILEERIGEGGFGYDPIFMPEGFTRSFAQMSIEEKNKISHRARAASKLLQFLRDVKEAR